MTQKIFIKPVVPDKYQGAKYNILIFYSEKEDYAIYSNISE